MSLESARTTDLYPEARVIVETEPAKYRSTAAGYEKISDATLFEFTQMTGVSTTTGVDGRSSATITFASHRDLLYGRARERKSRTKEREKEIAEYLGEVLKLSSMNEINPRRRPLSTGVRRLFGVPVEKLGRSGQRIFYVLENENGHTRPGSTPNSRTEEYATKEWYIADFSLMRRVWIDFRDRDGNWVAAFSGIISQVQDAYQVGDTPVVVISCSGMLRFFEITEFITQQAVVGDQLNWPFKTVSGFSPTPDSTTLGGMDAMELARLMVKQVNTQFSLTGDAFSSNRRPDDFYFHDTLFRAGVDEGYDGGRDVDPRRSFERLVTTVDDLKPKLLIDPQIVREDNKRLDVYRQAIRKNWDFASYESASALQIMSDAMKLTNYEFFDDPRGNIVMWAPRYDALPRLGGAVRVRGREKSAVAAAQSGYYETTKPIYGDDYSDVPFHDERYIIDDVSLLSWNLSESEDPVKTFGRITNQPHYIENVDENMRSAFNTAYTSYDGLTKNMGEQVAMEVQRLARRFGVRRHTFPNVMTGTGYGEVALLTRFAYAGLLRLNAYRFAGTISLEQRPELWPGRSVLLVERQKLGYITRIQNEFRPKQAHKTTLTLAYVHHPSERIGMPWWEATNEQPVVAQGIGGVLE